MPAPLSQEKEEGTCDMDIGVNIAKALFAAQKEMGDIGKSGHNDHQHYNYANLADFNSVVVPALEKNGLVLYESVARHTDSPGRQTKNGVANGCYLAVVGTLVHVESGESLSVSAWGEGQDSGDKSTYKAITGARKYLRAMFFNLVTTDDPEKDEKVGVGGNGSTHTQDGQSRASAPEPEEVFPL